LERAGARHLERREEDRIELATASARAVAREPVAGETDDRPILGERLRGRCIELVEEPEPSELLEERAGVVGPHRRAGPSGGDADPFEVAGSVGLAEHRPLPIAEVERRLALDVQDHPGLTAGELAPGSHVGAEPRTVGDRHSTRIAAAVDSTDARARATLDARVCAVPVSEGGPWANATERRGDRPRRSRWVRGLRGAGFVRRRFDGPEGRIGDRVGGRYELVRPIGRGGGGIVYEARAPRGDRVAVKLLHAHLRAST